MRNALADFCMSFTEAYRNNAISTDESYQLSSLLRTMEEYAPKMTQTKMYEVIYDMYIEEQSPILNECLELISGWNTEERFQFLVE